MRFFAHMRETCLNRHMEPSEEIGGERPSRPEVESLLARPGLRPPTEEVRASLAAIRAARVAAEIRLQRDSLRVRLLTMAFLAVFAGGTFALAAHLRARRHGPGTPRTVGAAITSPAHSAAAPSLAPGSALTIELSPPVLDAVPGGGSSSASSGASSGASSTAPGASEPAPPAPAPAVSSEERAAAVAACHDAYDRQRWRTAADACSRASELLPADAALAMKVAQAQHARGHYADAGVWARRAIDLEDVDPEALVILAHAERRAKHPAAAKSAYRRYLILAPRGWHAAEARAALHGARAEGRARSVRRAAGVVSAEATRQPLAEETLR
jgi:hypothetical protein